MDRKGKIGIVAAILVATGVGGLFQIRYLRTPTLLSDVRSEVRDIVNKADSVQVYRIQALDGSPDGPQIIDPPKRISGPIELSKDQIHRIKSARTKHGGSYDVPACMPNPGIEYVFNHDNRAVELDLCFTCGMAEIRDNKGHYGGGNFSHVSDRLTRLTIELFPNDPQIQALGHDPSMMETWPESK